LATGPQPCGRGQAPKARPFPRNMVLSTQMASRGATRLEAPGFLVKVLFLLSSMSHPSAFVLDQALAEDRSPSAMYIYVYISPGVPAKPGHDRVMERVRPEGQVGWIWAPGHHPKLHVVGS
jgi:hypothetical protein